ncbi:MAG: hypothetical protein ACYSTS_03675 [Planctomycetota bacterium]|jgi:type II secretory pathway predicted ATPase ExeA
MYNTEKTLNKNKKALKELKEPEHTETVQSAEHSKSIAKSIPSQNMNALESGPSIQNHLVMSETHKTNFFLSLYGKNKSEGCEVVAGTINASQNTVCQIVLKGPNKKNHSESLPDHRNHDDNRLETILQKLVILGKCSEEIVKKENIFQLIMFLLNDMANGESALLVIDDTQNILLPLMEQTRILSRMEAENKKLLQIIILGRMKRIQSLHSSKFKQTYQSAFVRQQSDKLKVNEIRKNIENRLKMDGPKEGICFSTEALTFIRNKSLGISYMADLMLENVHLSLQNKKAAEIKEEIVGDTVERLQFPEEQIDKKEENLINKIEKDVKIDGFHKHADNNSRDKENLIQRKDEIGISLDNLPAGKKIKALKKTYLICFGILTIIIVVIVSLLNRKQSAKEDLDPIYASAVHLNTENNVLTIQDISKTTHDDFDSRIKLKNHQQESVNSLNNAVKYHNHNYQAVTAILDTESLDTKIGKPPLSINWKPGVRQLDSEGHIKAPPGNKKESLLKEVKQKLINDKHGNVSELYEDTTHPDYDIAPINISSATSVMTMKMAKLYGIQALKDYSIEKKQLAQKDLSAAKSTMSKIYKTLLAYSPIAGNKKLVEVVKAAQSSWYQMEKMLSVPPSSAGFLNVLDISDRLLDDNEMMTSYVESFLPVHIAEIINNSGRLRMYAQKLARDYLAASIGVDKEYRVALMLDSAIEFESAMLMMEGVTENTAKIKDLIKSITEIEWRKVYEAATICIESDGTKFNISMMMEFCDTLLEKTNRLTKLYVEVVKT